MLSPETIRQAILDLKEPIIFRGFQQNVETEDNPEFLRWNLDKFLDLLGDSTLPFRIGDNARTPEPQWDIKCSLEYMTVSKFTKKAEINDNKKWYYFDYKYMHEWFNDRPEILESINWQRFGFDKTGKDSTLWIGSKGAHTNCHQDSYGCNLVAQLHGRKQWLLFPPDSGKMIKPTRVPYEESTVYSKLNFFCPTKDDEEAIMKITESPKLVELKSGEVLLVPNGWWHYVESLDSSVSMNVWLPVESDYKGRLKEALVKLIAKKIGQDVPSAPEDQPYTFREHINLINTCIEEYYKNKETSRSVSSEKRIKKISWTAEDLVKQYPNNVKLLPELSGPELRKFLAEKRERFPELKTFSESSDENSEDPEFQRSLENVLNSMCHFDVINKVADLLLDTKR